MRSVINRKMNWVMLIGVLFFNACNSQQKSANEKSNITDTITSRKQIGNMLDSFNTAAAKADYNKYFSYYTDDAVFTGTDATERWDKKAFMIWAKPFFDKGRAWNFTALRRHIYFDQTGNVAWFDELLNTQMKICRGSGVVVKQGNDWKVAQYILSATIPNPQMDSVTKMKTVVEDAIINSLKK